MGLVIDDFLDDKGSVEDLVQSVSDSKPAGCQAGGQLGLLFSAEHSTLLSSQAC